MKKNILTLLLLSCISFPVFAQHWIEVVYLKNGGRIKGTVIEQVPGESLKIMTSDESIFVFRMDEVERIVKEEVQPARQNGNPASYGYPAGKPASEKPPYSGRAKEGKVMIDLGVGLAPNKWTENANFDAVVKKVVPSEYWSMFSFAKNAGFTAHAGLEYDRFFKPGSPWFWEAGAFAEMQNTGLDGFFQYKRFVRCTATTWNFAAQAGAGIQTSPNTEGMHFYIKAGASVGYIAIGDIKAKGSGEAAGLEYDLDALDAHDLNGEGSIFARPLGFGNDSFFRFGIRYSPLFGNYLLCHCITANVSIPLM